MNTTETLAHFIRVKRLQTVYLPLFWPTGDLPVPRISLKVLEGFVR